MTAERASDLTAEASAAVVRADSAGCSLLEAVAWYAKEGRTIREAPSLSTCLTEFLWSREAAGRRPETIKGYRVSLTRFCRAYGNWQPHEFRVADIEAFLELWPSANSRYSWYRKLFSFFAWLVAKGYAFQNPVDQVASRPPRAGGDGSIYSPEEVLEILRRTARSDQLGFWVLSLFAGLRTTEIRRLQLTPDPWSLVRMDARVIEIPAEHAKNRRRALAINKVLWRWLQQVKQARIPFFPRNAAKKIRRLKRSVLRKSRGRGRMRTSNMGRRSFISYSVALPGASYLRIAADAGNSEAVIRKYYRCSVSRADARAYFSMSPKKVMQVQP